MKHTFNLLTASCCLALTNACCQNNYHNIEDFREGTVLVFQNCESSSFETGKRGMDVIWDFSNLKPAKDTTTQWIIHPASIPEAANFPEADLAEKYSNGNYVFLKKEGNKTFLVGFISEASKINIHYPQPVLIAKRPFSYGENITDSFTTSYTVNDMGFTGQGAVSIEADGFGTLILPNNKYEDVLRIKITQKQSDVLKQYNYSFETSVTTYVWFDRNHNSALLKMTETISRDYQKMGIEYLLSETVR